MRISVFIPSYNQRELLREAVDSVLAQTLRPFQIIIVDDASTDGSRDLIRGYVNQFPALVEAVFHETNQGIARTRIDALSAVTGDYVTYVDGDDRFRPKKLEKEAAAMRRSGAQIAFSDYYYITQDGRRTGLWAGETKPPEGNVFLALFGHQYPRRSTYRMEMVEYRAWKKVGFHDPNLTIYEDFDMRIRLTKRLRTAYCALPLSEVRESRNGLSRSAPEEHFRALRYILGKHAPILREFSRTERRRACQEYRAWMASAPRERARRLMNQEGHRARALGWFLLSARLSPRELDAWLALRIFLPLRAYSFARRVFAPPRPDRDSCRVGLRGEIRPRSGDS